MVEYLPYCTFYLSTTIERVNKRMYAVVSGTALLESFCQQEIHLQNPTSNPQFQVVDQSINQKFFRVARIA